MPGRWLNFAMKMQFLGSQWTLERPGTRSNAGALEREPRSERDHRSDAVVI